MTPPGRKAKTVQDLPPIAAVTGTQHLPPRCGTARVGRNVAFVLVERCWVCLEQPAVTTVPGADGRNVPVCDICAVEHPHGPDATGPITDDDLRRIVGDLSA
jgi:hypothetical protein